MTIFCCINQRSESCSRKPEPRYRAKSLGSFCSWLFMSSLLTSQFFWRNKIEEAKGAIDQEAANPDSCFVEIKNKDFVRNVEYSLVPTILFEIHSIEIFRNSIYWELAILIGCTFFFFLFRLYRNCDKTESSDSTSRTFVDSHENHKWLRKSDSETKRDWKKKAQGGCAVGCKSNGMRLLWVSRGDAIKELDVLADGHPHSKHKWSLFK